MSLKDLPAHNRGRRHQIALSKVDANLRPLPESADIAPAVDPRKVTQVRGIGGSDKTSSTARHLNSLAFNDSADSPVGSFASETIRGSTFSTDIVKQKTKKAKRSKKVKLPNNIVKSIAIPPASSTNEYVALVILNREIGERDQTNASSASPPLILSKPTLEPLLPRRVLPRKEVTLFRLSSRSTLPSNTTAVLHRMTSSNVYALSTAGHRIM